MTNWLLFIQLLVLLVFGVVGFQKLGQIHVLVNSRLTTALDEISALKNMLTVRGVAVPPNLE